MPSRSPAAVRSSDDDRPDRAARAKFLRLAPRHLRLGIVSRSLRTRRAARSARIHRPARHKRRRPSGKWRGRSTVQSQSGCTCWTRKQFGRGIVHADRCLHYHRSGSEAATLQLPQGCSQRLLTDSFHSSEQISKACVSGSFLDLPSRSGQSTHGQIQPVSFASISVIGMPLSNSQKRKLASAAKRRSRCTAVSFAFSPSIDPAASFGLPRLHGRLG